MSFKPPVIIKSGIKIELGRGVVPAFGHLGTQGAGRAVRSFIADLLENPEFYASEPPDFTEDWFDRVQRAYQNVLNAQKIANERTGKPVNKETADSQRRIARVILDRVQAAKAIIASAQPRQIINRIIGKLVWLGGDACGGRGIRESKNKGDTIHEVDFAISIKQRPPKSLRIWRIWNGPTLVYEMSAAEDWQKLIGNKLNLNGGGMLLSTTATKTRNRRRQ
jgi:hypothetical protein